MSPNHKKNPRVDRFFLVDWSWVKIRMESVEEMNERLIEEKPRLKKGNSGFLKTSYDAVL